jgi:hypothetical protein
MDSPLYAIEHCGLLRHVEMEAHAAGGVTVSRSLRLYETRDGRYLVDATEGERDSEMRRATGDCALFGGLEAAWRYVDLLRTHAVFPEIVGPLPASEPRYLLVFDMTCNGRIPTFKGPGLGVTVPLTRAGLFA